MKRKLNIVDHLSDQADFRRWKKKRGRINMADKKLRKSAICPSISSRSCNDDRDDVLLTFLWLFTHSFMSKLVCNDLKARTSYLFASFKVIFALLRRISCHEIAAWNLLSTIVIAYVPIDIEYLCMKLLIIYHLIVYYYY